MTFLKRVYFKQEVLNDKFLTHWGLWSLLLTANSIDNSMDNYSHAQQSVGW